MKLLIANGLFPAILFPPRELGQFSELDRAGSNGKDIYVEALFAETPPVVPRKICQISLRQPLS